jgi:ABC-type multidrug transport system fused ATPase/permease subunit
LRSKRFIFILCNYIEVDQYDLIKTIINKKVTGFLNGFLTSLSDAELGLVSLERLQQYANLPSEPPLTLPIKHTTPNGSGGGSSGGGGGGGGLSPKRQGGGGGGGGGGIDIANINSRQVHTGLNEPLLTTISSTATSTATAGGVVPVSYDPTPPWPSKGVIEFENVSMSYRKGLPNVLNHLSLKVLAGQKVGIVG